MFKRLLFGLFLLVFMGMVPMGCFQCEVPDYAILREFSLFISEPVPGVRPLYEPPLADGARTSAPALSIDIVRLEYDYVSTTPLKPLFTGQAMAWQCDDPGSLGWKDQAATVTLTSTGSFNGVAAGQPLNQFVQCRNFRAYPDTLEFPLAQLADTFNRLRYGSIQGPFRLRISPKPRDNAQQQFELRIQLQSGKIVTQTTPAISWE